MIQITLKENLLPGILIKTADHLWTSIGWSELWAAFGPQGKKARGVLLQQLASGSYGKWRLKSL